MTKEFASIEELGNYWSLADHVEDALIHGTGPDEKSRARGHNHASTIANSLHHPVVKKAIGGLSAEALDEFRQILEINGVSADLDF